MEVAGGGEEEAIEKETSAKRRVRVREREKVRVRVGESDRTSATFKVSMRGTQVGHITRQQNAGYNTSCLHKMPRRSSTHDTR